MLLDILFIIGLFVISPSLLSVDLEWHDDVEEIGIAVFANDTGGGFVVEVEGYTATGKGLENVYDIFGVESNLDLTSSGFGRYGRFGVTGL